MAGSEEKEGQAGGPHLVGKKRVIMDSRYREGDTKGNHKGLNCCQRQGKKKKNKNKNKKGAHTWWGRRGSSWSQRPAREWQGAGTRPPRPRVLEAERHTPPPPPSSLSSANPSPCALRGHDSPDRCWRAAGGPPPPLTQANASTKCPKWASRIGTSPRGTQRSLYARPAAVVLQHLPLPPPPPPPRPRPSTGSPRSPLWRCRRCV